MYPLILVLLSFPSCSARRVRDLALRIILDQCHITLHVGKQHVPWPGGSPEYSLFLEIRSSVGQNIWLILHNPQATELVWWLKFKYCLLLHSGDWFRARSVNFQGSSDDIIWQKYPAIWGRYAVFDNIVAWIAFNLCPHGAISCLQSLPSWRNWK